MERVAPDGVLSDVGLRRGHDDVVAEGYLLALLREDVVAIGLLQGIDTVLARSDTFHLEAPGGVGARYSEHGCGGECRVAQVVVESHENAFHWLQVLCLEHVACHLHGVDGRTGGETEGVVAHGVALVVVGDGIGEIDGVGGVGAERVVELYGDAPACSLYLGSLQLGWRDDHFLRGVVEFDELVEEDGDVVGVDVCRPVFGYGADNTGWGFVIPPPVGLPHAGAARESHDGGSEYVDDVSSHAFIAISSSMTRRLLESLGTLFCPPSLPLDFIHWLKRFWRAGMISRCCKVMSL